MKDEDYIYDSNTIVSKLLKLKYRINDAYDDHDIGAVYNISDKDFVIGLIHNIRKRDRNPSKIQLEECNKIWSKYK